MHKRALTVLLPAYCIVIITIAIMVIIATIIMVAVIIMISRCSIVVSLLQLLVRLSFP